VYDHGIDAAFSVVPGPMELMDAIDRVDTLLADRAEAVTRTWMTGRGA